MNKNVKSDDIHIAEKILLDAGQAIRDRHVEHGHTERSFQMIAELWSTYITHAYTIRNEAGLKSHDIAMLMDLVKTARSVYGYSVDNFTDKAGYSALAAMLTPQPGQHPPKEEYKSADLLPKISHPPHHKG
jgi:hypothetical protein